MYFFIFQKGKLFILVQVKERLLTQRSMLVVLNQFIADIYLSTERISQKCAKISLRQVNKCHFKRQTMNSVIYFIVLGLKNYLLFRAASVLYSFFRHIHLRIKFE